MLVAVNGLVGAMLGQERTVVPLLAEARFGLSSHGAALTFIAAFGVAKAAANYAAGTLADRLGRRPVLLLGWGLGLPIPFLLAFAPSWSWIVAANVLLGVQQGLTWSATVIMKIDLAGPRRRGLVTGLNEAAGYLAVAATALVTGQVAAARGLDTAPFLLGLVIVGLGAGLSATLVRETLPVARAEARRVRDDGVGDGGAAPSRREVLRRVTVADRSLSSCTQAGLVTNLNDGLAWGLFPVHFAAAGVPVGTIGVLVALYPAVWGLGQLVTGPLSDRVGRRGLIITGMLLQSVALVVVAAVDGVGAWAAASALLGVGTAAVYPTLLAAVGDAAPASWRASAVGVYRLWRDLGFAVGAVLAGALADWLSVPAAIAAVGVLTGVSGMVVLRRMPTSRTLGPAAVATPPPSR